MLIVVLFITLSLYAGALYWTYKKKLLGRIQLLERSLQDLSEMISQMAEIQTKAIQKSSCKFEDIDERIMDLSIPSQDTNLPVEKRRQVLALARQGVPLEDIAKRLKAPVGEAELILNLSQYLDGERRPSAQRQRKEQVSSYV
jgi:hypothetical protein